MYIWRFPTAMHREPIGRYRCPKFFEGCGRVLIQEQQTMMGTCLTLSSWASSSLLPQHRSTAMTTCPHPYSTHVSGHQQHAEAQAHKIRGIVLDLNCPGSIIINVRTITSNKQFLVIMATGHSTMCRRWKSPNTNGHCAQTNRHNKFVYAPQWII